ncbi:hypothetical protein D3C77_273910 [compost metagenome]
MGDGHPRMEALILSADANSPDPALAQLVDPGTAFSEEVIFLQTEFKDRNAVIRERQARPPAENLLTTLSGFSALR